MQKLILILDWRREATDVRKLLKDRNLLALQKVRNRLVESPHDYPDGLLRILRAEVPKLVFHPQQQAELSAADDLCKTIEWEAYARDRQQVM